MVYAAFDPEPPEGWGRYYSQDYPEDHPCENGHMCKCGYEDGHAANCAGDCLNCGVAI